LGYIIDKKGDIAQNTHSILTVKTPKIWVLGFWISFQFIFIISLFLILKYMYL
jgi:hypothetical protein